jgi:2-haloacid dehalogenase
MKRRALLQGLGGAALAACTHSPQHAAPRVLAVPPPRGPLAPAPPGGITPIASRARVGVQAIAFDLFTLFDPRGVERRAAVVLEDDPAGFAAAWKTRLFEHCWLRASAGAYAPFERLVADSLAITARVRKVALTDAARAHLAAGFTALEPWPDTVHALHALRRRGLRLAPLANFSPAMIRALLGSAALDGLFERQISTDEVRTYKPDPRAYALAEHHFQLPRARIAFAAFGGWDAWGAHAFGLPTFWVDRLATVDVLDAAVASGPDLGALLAWIA